jgi:ADP-heptose:LPS heptosyltransferase
MILHPPPRDSQGEELSFFSFPPHSGEGKARRKPDEIHRILIIRAGALGDTLLMLPLIRALRQAFPEAYLEVMGYPERLQLVLGESYAHHISSIERKGLEAFFVKDALLPPDLVRFFGSFDLILSYKQDPEGLWTENLRKTGATLVYNFNPFPSEENPIHMISYLLNTLKILGLNIPVTRLPGIAEDFTQEQIPDLYYPRIQPPPWAREKAHIFWKENQLPMEGKYRVLAVHPGSGSPKKVWPPERFAQVCLEASRQYQTRILLISGPADKENVQKVFKLSEDIHPVLVENKPLWLLAAILERCHIYLGNDSGVTHLAAAVGVPVLALFGPSNPKIWRPLGEKVKVLQAGMEVSQVNATTPVTPYLPKGLESLQVASVMKVLGSMIQTPRDTAQGPSLAVW